VKPFFLLCLFLFSLTGCNADNSTVERVQIIEPKDGVAVSRAAGLHVRVIINVEYDVQSVDIELNRVDEGLIQKWTVATSPSKFVKVDEQFTLSETNITDGKYTLSVLANPANNNVKAGFGFSKSIELIP
jgi:hypothetical protein